MGGLLLYIWYSEEGPGNSPPINGQCTNHCTAIWGPLLCGFNVAIKGLIPFRKAGGPYAMMSAVCLFVRSSVCGLKLGRIAETNKDVTHVSFHVKQQQGAPLLLKLPLQKKLSPPPRKIYACGSGSQQRCPICFTLKFVHAARAYSWCMSLNALSCNFTMLHLHNFESYASGGMHSQHPNGDPPLVLFVFRRLLGCGHKYLTCGESGTAHC